MLYKWEVCQDRNSPNQMVNGPNVAVLSGEQPRLRYHEDSVDRGMFRR